MSPAPAGTVAPHGQAGFRRRQVRIGDGAFRHRIGTGLGQCPVHPGRFQAPHTDQVCRYSTPLFPAGVVCLLPTSPDHRGRERVKPVVAPCQPSSSNVCAGSRNVAKHEAVGPPFHQLPRERGLRLRLDGLPILDGGGTAALPVSVAAVGLGEGCVVYQMTRRSMCAPWLGVSASLRSASRPRAKLSPRPRRVPRR